MPLHVSVKIVVAYLRMMNGTHLEVIYLKARDFAFIVVARRSMNFGWTTHNEKWNYKLEP